MLVITQLKESQLDSQAALEQHLTGCEQRDQVSLLSSQISNKNLNAFSISKVSNGSYIKEIQTRIWSLLNNL